MVAVERSIEVVEASMEVVGMQAVKSSIEVAASEVISTPWNDMEYSMVVVEASIEISTETPSGSFQGIFYGNF